MSYSEDNYLMISGIQHFIFCRRQWALIHVEQQWQENLRTVEGKILHTHVHDAEFHEKRNDVIYARAMAVSSASLGVSGECDLVEFHVSPKGIPIFRYAGTYEVVPVEYKRGKSKEDASDRMQLVVQAMCLEEMLCCEIPYGFLYYGETKHREKVRIDEAQKQKARAILAEMHQLYERRVTPKGKRTKACNSCSLKEICLPVLSRGKSASSYFSKMLEGGQDD